MLPTSTSLNGVRPRPPASDRAASSAAASIGPGSMQLRSLAPSIPVQSRPRLHSQQALTSQHSACSTSIIPHHHNNSSSSMPSFSPQLPLQHLTCRTKCRATELHPAASTTPELPIPAPTSFPAAPASASPTYSPTTSTIESYQSMNEAMLADAPERVLRWEATMLLRLLQAVQQAGDLEGKVAVLQAHPRVQAFMSDPRHARVASSLAPLPLSQRFLLLCLPAIGQAHVLQEPPAAPAASPSPSPQQQQQQQQPEPLAPALASLASTLARVEAFYDSMGGLLGYQLKSLQLIVAGMAEHQQGSSSSSSSYLQQQDETPQPRASASGSGSTSPSSSESDSESQLVAETQFHVPPGMDLAGEGGRELGAAAAAQGLLAMPYMAEVYPVGGAGDRLGLRDEASGESLPSALLPYCGRPIIQGLLRDLQAREYLAWKLTGQQVHTPVAIMTSDAKGNHQRMTQLMAQLNWLGRGEEGFRMFRQPLVPVLAVESGRWLLSAPLRPMLKPGGHGALWKLMRDEGVFDWLGRRNCRAALIRQISNPLAGSDTTLLALVGRGYSQGHAFGFMSCERAVGASEGMNVLQERKVWAADKGRWVHEYGVTNVEYTEFERLGINDQPASSSSDEAVGTPPGSPTAPSAPSSKPTSLFPANTNVLYVGLQAAEAVVQQAVASGSSARLLPSLIFNLKKKVGYRCPLEGPGAEEVKVAAGRMECTMQNLADYLTDRFDAPLSTPAERRSARLSTFMMSNLRRKVTSSAKKRRAPGSTKIAQTPDGSFYDLMRNAWHLLQLCGMVELPEVGSVEQYLARGPGFIFLFHPALGPLWDVIRQKLQGGSLQPGSEVVLEVAEARVSRLHVDGSLLVHADSVAGHMEGGEPQAAGAEAGAGGGGAAEGQRLSGASACRPPTPVECRPGSGRLRYSARVGRLLLSNVRVRNLGVDWCHASNVYWKHQVQRHEALVVKLHGDAEFEAHDVEIVGDHVFEVPAGHRMVLTPGPGGHGFRQQLLPLAGGAPSWEWRYSMDQHSGAISLFFESRHTFDAHAHAHHHHTSSLAHQQQQQQQ